LEIDASFGDLPSNLNFALLLNAEYRKGPWVLVVDPVLCVCLSVLDTLANNNDTLNARPAAPRGRPKRPIKELRSRRVVTFLTESELQELEDIAASEDRSLSAAVHRIVSLQLSHLRS